MSLFVEQSDQTGEHRARSVRIGWTVLGVSLALLVVLGVSPAPYVIEIPGPVFNTLGTTEHDDETVPLISVEGAKTYPTEGSLDLLTVRQVGNRENRPGWFEVAAAWFDPARAVVPVDVAFPPNVSTEQMQEQSQALMVDSQQDAIAAALVELGYEFPREVTVGGLADGSPAEGVIEEGDVITAFNGAPVHDTQALRDAVALNGAGTPASVEIERDGVAQTVEVTPVEAGPATVIGVNVRMHYEFPIEVTIQLDNVGGPSAGQMFALGIIDTLTPGFLNGGENVAGTGTIDSAGNIGAIGGIRQKMFGAKDAGARWFLAPEVNCDEVVGHIPAGLTVFAVATLDDALAALDAVAAGEDTGALPGCSATS